MAEPIVQVEELTIEYRKRFRTPVAAVRNLSFEFHDGEVIGFLGPNGAGKSSTIKAMMGFLFPSGGRITILGHPAGSAAAKRDIGYLPEVALYYPFMKARELLRLYGGLSEIARADLEQRIDHVIEMVGLKGREDALLRTYSKGMQQRLGIAQALIGDPRVLILDEVSSGLDPLGRRDLRQILRTLHKEGKTIFFSSHELSEVEMLCDRIIIINRGRKVIEGALENLVRPIGGFFVQFRERGQERRDPTVREGEGRAGNGLPKLPHEPERLADGSLRLHLTPQDNPQAVLRDLVRAEAEIVEFHSERGSLEERFVRIIQEDDEHSAE
jgi:ABC-2 type transport system ATP-binding protein